MFVSSYSTYINTNNSDKLQRDRESSQKDTKSSFSSKLLNKPLQLSAQTSTFPINYVSNYKVLNNQQKLQEQEQNSEKVKFTKINSLTSAKEAYTNNSKIFSLLVKPRATLNQTPRVDKRMPQDIQEAQEKNIRYKMVNTYIENDNYYKITA